MEDKYTSDQIINMLSLNEEISNLNYKIKQTVEDLHKTQEGLGSLQELATTLNDKISQFKNDTTEYKPREIQTDEGATPSYVVDGNGSSAKRDRIVPGPENYHLYQDSPIAATAAVVEETVEETVEEPVTEPTVTEIVEEPVTKVATKTIKAPLRRRPPRSKKSATKRQRALKSRKNER